MTDKPLQRVQKFHQTFQVETSKTPCIPEKSICQLRIDLIQEELNELKEAFVVDGTYDVCGLSDYKEPISEEIFNSNMSKADENGRPIFREDGKVLKGPNYFRPNLHKVLGLKNQEDNDNA